jgi:iron complex outermembrane recepter protein
VGPHFYDIARIEVLKGPQGTLYGRNATAGAVNIVANQPTDELGGSVTAEIGNYDLQKYVGVFNLPISDTLWTRAAVQYVGRNGYLSDGTDDDQQKSGRLQMLWKPTGEFSALVTADYEHAGGYGGGAVLLPRQPGTGPFTGSIDATNNAALLAAADVPPFIVVTPGAGPNPTPANSTGLNRDSQRDNTQRNVSGEFNYDLGFANLTFLPALRTANNTYFGYTPGFPYGDRETVRQQSYELRLAKTTDFIKAVGGLYFFDDRQTIDQSATISVFVPPLHTKLDTDLGTKSYAGFGQATVSITDAARLIGGIRYTHEVKTIDGSRTQIPLGAASLVTPLDSSASFNSVNFRAGFEYDLTDWNMLYGTVSTGFKAGGFNTFQSQNGISDVYQPEKLTDYELGVRNRFLDNRLQFNAQAFYWQDKNSQQSHLTYDPTGSLQFETLNAASASIYGMDFDIVAKPWDAGTLTMVLEYLHTEFKDFVYDIPSANFAPASIGCATGPSAGNTGFTTIDCSGKPLPRAPNWSGTVSYQHTFDVYDGATLVTDVDLNFSSQRYLAVDYIGSELAPSYIRENATLTYNAPGNRWSVAVFGRNLSNRAVYLGGVQAALSPGIFYSTVDAPRTFGARLNVNFR